jgi:uncharacterized membrane protein YfcA
MFATLILIPLGVLAGFLSGLFSLGGGITVTPALAFTLPHFGVQADSLMKVAIGTALSIMFINSLSTAYHHNKTTKIDYKVIKAFSPSIIIGSIIGCTMASKLPSNALLAFFILFLGYIIVIKFKKNTVPNSAPVTEPEHLAKLIIIPYGIITGIISASVGGGSSFMIVPFLNRRGYPIREGVAISSLFNAFLALTGALSYLLLGLHDKTLPHYCIGYIYLPAFLLVLLGSFFGVPLGVRLIKFIPEQKAKIFYFTLTVFIFFLMLAKLLQTTKMFTHF